MESRALGKGLSALIPEKINMDKPGLVTFVRTMDIVENPNQPRLEFDSEKLTDLISSIKEKGVLQPILVRRKNDGYEVVAGERRLRAARALGMDEVPVVVKNLSDEESLVVALIENLQREELNAIESARAFKRLIDEFNFTQDIVAQQVAKDRSTITNFLRLLRLPGEIQKSISDGKISMGHARALLGVEDQKKQKALFEKTIKKGLSVRESENLVKPELLKAGRARKSAHRNTDPYLAALEEELQGILGTKVCIQSRKKRGKIIIEFYSSDELDRITNTIKKR